MERRIALILLLALTGLSLLATEQPVKPEISINCHDIRTPLFRCGEKARIRIQLPKVEGADETFRVMLFDDSGKILLRKKLNAEPAKTYSFSGTLSEPGFLSCRVIWRKAGRVLFQPVVASVGFDVEKIVPGAESPKDFLKFWAKSKARFDREVSPDYQVTKIRDKGHAVEYEVTSANYDGTRTYSYLSVPSAPGIYPLLVNVPPAGPGIWRARGGGKRIAATINVHHQKLGLENGNQDREAFKQLNTPLLYAYQGAPDREKYYYYKSILGVMRILDYLTKMKEWDGEHLVMHGQSQGGAFSLMMGGLYPKVSAVCAEMPALCDHSGRYPGWPRLLKNVKTAAEMAGYYDTVNFCRTVNCPVIVGVGCIDTMCTPRSVLAACNVIPSTNKKIIYGAFSGHGWGEPLSEFLAERKKFIDVHLATKIK